MKTCAKCNIEKERSCFGNRSGVADGLRPHCKQCRKEESRLRYASHKEYFATYYIEHRVKKLAMAKQRTKTLDKVKENADANRRYHAQRERYSLPMKRYRLKNMAKYAAFAMKRKASQLGATPRYANHFFIHEVYDLALRRTAVTGFKWQVDHIVPLLSKRVCGLHVEHNLAVIPAEQNNRKGNWKWPEMP